MTSLFLSYSRDDSVFMRTLLNNLRKLGFNVWIDEEHLTVGTPEWEEAIAEAVEQVDALVVILSPPARKSKWVNIELRLADLYETPVLPVLAAGSEKTAVPPRLLGMQYADMRGRSDYEGGFRDLTKGLADKLGLTVSEFEMDFSGAPQVQVNVYGQNEGTIVAVGRDVARDLIIAGGDVTQSERTEPSAPPPAEPTTHSAAELTRLTLDLLPPPFEWLDIPAGRVTLEDDAKSTFEVQPFQMAKYPVTYAQFQVFVDAPDGFANDAWWQGLAQREAEPGQQRWPIADRPRERVNWYDAVAFCRWLGSRLDTEVRLPAEWEWQWAAQGPDGLVYPYGNTFDKDKCNTHENGVEQTTPVDRYPAGASPFGLLDMSGNVWEWCVNEFDVPGNTGPAGTAPRVVRGGSWFLNVEDARAAVRFRNHLLARNASYGFRVAVGAAVPVR